MKRTEYIENGKDDNPNDEIDKVDSIFKVMLYRHRCHSKRKLHYPSFRVSGSNEIYFKTMEEVEEYMQKRSHKTHPADEDYIDLYAYVVIEVPLREEMNVDVLDQNLTFRTYLPDGTLWGKNDYGNFMSKRAVGEDFNYWGRRNQFWGRKPEEIRFKPGDIVEVLGCPGNDYWGNDTVNLAIVVKTPPTIAEVEEMRKRYFAIHSGSDLCDHALNIEFDYSLDTYEVLSYGYDGIDHAPTICVFEPTKKVSSKRRKALMEMYKKHGKKIKQLTEDELHNLIKVATSRLSGEMNSNGSMQMNCAGNQANIPDGLFDEYYGTTFKFFGLGPIGLPTHVLFALERVTMIEPNKTILYGNVTIRTSQVNGEKIIIDFTKNRVKYRNRQEKCIYDLEIDNRFKPLWEKFTCEIKKILLLK